MAEKKSQADHQRELAQSGYRLPENMYQVPDDQPSTEEKSGDGGTAASEIDSDASPHGYKGPLKTKKEQAADAEDKRTYDPETGQSIPGAVEEQAEANRKAGLGPIENKADVKVGGTKKK